MCWVKQMVGLCVCVSCRHTLEQLSTRPIENCIQSKKDPQIIAQCRRWSLARINCTKRQKKEREEKKKTSARSASRSMTNSWMRLSSNWMQLFINIRENKYCIFSYKSKDHNRQSILVQKAAFRCKQKVWLNGKNSTKCIFESNEMEYCSN